MEEQKSKCPLRSCLARDPHEDRCKMKVIRAKQKAKERELKKKEQNKIQEIMI